MQIYCIHLHPIYTPDSEFHLIFIIYTLRLPAWGTSIPWKEAWPIWMPSTTSANWFTPQVNALFGRMGFLILYTCIDVQILFRLISSSGILNISPLMLWHSSQVCAQGHGVHEGCYHSVGALSFWTFILQGGSIIVWTYFCATCLISSHSSPYLHAGLAKHLQSRRKSSLGLNSKKSSFHVSSLATPGMPSDTRRRTTKRTSTETVRERARGRSGTRKPRRIMMFALAKRTGAKNDPKDHMLIYTFWGKLWETCATKSQATTCSLHQQFAVWPVLFAKHIRQMSRRWLAVFNLNLSVLAVVLWNQRNLGPKMEEKNHLPIHAVLGLESTPAS